jgi:phosphatidylglycerol:prolipoprotein diacylglycerol transferase
VHPYLLHSGHFLLPTFGVLAAGGLMAALGLSLRTATAVGLNPDKLWNAGLFAILSAFLLSRVLLIVANPHNFIAYPILLLMVPSLTATGILLTAFITALYLRLRNLPLLTTLDAWAPCATLAWVFLSAGHFFEGSDAGLPTTLPWGFPIPPGSTSLHPVPLYVSLAAAILTVALLLHLLFGITNRHRPGSTFALAIAAAGLVQFFLTFFRQPYPYPASVNTCLDPIQWISLGMIVAAGFILLQSRKLVPHAV